MRYWGVKGVKYTPKDQYWEGVSSPVFTILWFYTPMLNCCELQSCNIGQIVPVGIRQSKGLYFVIIFKPEVSDNPRSEAITILQNTGKKRTLLITLVLKDFYSKVLLFVGLKTLDTKTLIFGFLRFRP